MYKPGKILRTSYFLKFANLNGATCMFLKSLNHLHFFFEVGGKTKLRVNLENIKLNS